jgi:hypothetical protein
MEVQALVRGSDDVADLPAGETVFGEPRMVGDPRITAAQASVALTMTRQRVWNLIGPAQTAARQSLPGLPTTSRRARPAQRRRLARHPNPFRELPPIGAMTRGENRVQH